ncbi:DUF3493 domain-containing protein [Leptolyngbya sp. PCC 6406]|uniref:DUF3493 domain-containing protein n=1 Tax=Leptolyngbya sp. PCC 6406 TaxID=1173264 RepID=UPI0002ABAF3A|nr:DUF3493 domain-containing protein [Leptolyngbya sp. PCC 6406]
MTDPSSPKSRRTAAAGTPPPGMSPERYARLVAEAKAPYRGFRKFIYGAFGISGAIGAFVFLSQMAAGRDVANALPNLLLQVGLVALMVFLFRLESRFP